DGATFLFHRIMPSDGLPAALVRGLLGALMFFSHVAYMSRTLSSCQRWSAREIRVLHEVPRVLVVDDNAGAAEALATYLSYEGVEARAANGGEQGLACVRAW